MPGDNARFHHNFLLKRGYKNRNPEVEIDDNKQMKSYIFKYYKNVSIANAEGSTPVVTSSNEMDLGGR